MKKLTDFLVANSMEMINNSSVISIEERNLLFSIIVNEIKQRNL